MKKIYLRPTMLAVALHQCQILAVSDVTDVSSNVDVGYNGEGTGPARVKEHNIWDEEWRFHVQRTMCYL